MTSGSAGTIASELAGNQLHPEGLEMRGIRLTTVVMGCVLGLASGASAQVTPVVAGDSITAAGINAIIVGPTPDRRI